MQYRSHGGAGGSHLAHALRGKGRRGAGAAVGGTAKMAKATLTISSKNYSSWSLRGWLLAKFSGLEFEEKIVPPEDPAARGEILLLCASVLVPCLATGVV